MTKCTIFLDDLVSYDSLQHHVGGKAYSCALLREANLPVPNGFVVMRPSSITKNALKAQLKDALSYFSGATLFAVRSSAREEDSTNHSFAGIHKTRLNVSPENLFDAIQDVQGSAYSKQAQAYRKVQGLNEADENSMSIFVQEMVQAKVSGVAFTMNPITYDKSEMVINASWGLGESLVSGRVEPDEYHVRKVDNNIISSQLGKKQYLMSTESGCTKMTETDQKQQGVHSLSESQIQKLCKLLLIIEKKYVRPQDIEWCFDGHQFWIVQSRPIIITKQHTENPIEWSRANLIEILPELVTPLTLSFLCEQINNGYRVFYSNILAPEEKLGPIIKPFYGRPYFNLTQLRYMCAVTGTPEADILMMMGHGSEIKVDTQIKKRPVSLLKILPALMRINWKQITVKSIMRKQLNDMNQFKKEYANFKFHQSSIQEMMAFIRDSAIYIQRPLQAVLLIPGALILYEKLLRKICDRKQVSYDKLLQSQLWRNPLSVSTAQMYDLLKLAQIARSEEATKNFFTALDDNDYANKLSGTHFLTEFNRFLNKYGHRGPHESELALPSYQEDPTPLLDTIKQHLCNQNFQTPDEISSQKHQEAQETWHAFVQRLSAWEKIFISPMVKLLLKRVKQRYLWREQLRFETTWFANAARQCYLAIANYFIEQGWIAHRDDIFYLLPDEIQQAIDNTKQNNILRELIDKRRANYDTWRDLKMPLHMHEPELPSLLRQSMANDPTETSITQLHGLCVSAGCIEGEVLVLRNPREFKKMKQGAILVAPATDPSWTPLFTLATGVIVEIGGILSHASLVAREYGLPALANVYNATTFLHDGQRIRLDATNGIIILLD